MSSLSKRLLILADWALLVFSCVHAVCESLTLPGDVAMQNGSLTTKNSPARNLHRLVSAVDFIKVLLQNLSQEPPVTLHTACADAYNKCASDTGPQVRGWQYQSSPAVACLCRKFKAVRGTLAARSQQAAAELTLLGAAPTQCLKGLSP